MRLIFVIRMKLLRIKDSSSITLFKEQQRRSQRAAQRERFAQITEILEETVIEKQQIGSSVTTPSSQRNRTF